MSARTSRGAGLAGVEKDRAAADAHDAERFVREEGRGGTARASKADDTAITSPALALVLKRRRFLGPDAYAFGGPAGEYQSTIRTAWESLVLLAHGVEPTRTRRKGRVNRAHLAAIDLRWHDLRHEAACRWLGRGLDLRAIQLLLGHADLKTTQRYLNVTDEELRKTMRQKLWNRK